jgi:hypothetical protein
MFFKQVSALPLAIFRLCFGTLMLLSTLRFWLKGWIEELYIKPIFHFSYYGFEWVKPIKGEGIYILFFVMGVAALFVALGLLYRLATIIFFLSFTYLELIDKTNYLNHYYLVSLLSFLLIFLPAHAYLSVDAWIDKRIYQEKISNIYLITIRLQLLITYFFAGVAKINSDWLLAALPLKIWLSTKTDLPFIGYFLLFPVTAYLFSWGGMLFDISIGFLLWWGKTRPVAYIFVLLFHGLTAILFPQIGMFPLMMVVNTLVFFSFEKQHNNSKEKLQVFKNQIIKKISLSVFIFYFSIQCLLPMRYLYYPDSLFWTEEGYRFSWRVMLMEKTGATFFTVKDANTGLSEVINNGLYLSPLQEKMMSTQPDMILQFAHFLRDKYIEKGFRDPMVFVESYVSLNGRANQQFINPKVNLAKETDSFVHKTWILEHE